MKTWQIFFAGCIVLIAIESLPKWEFVIAGIVSSLLIATVMAGFFLRPKKEVFILRTNVFVVDDEDDVLIEHDRIAVRVEVARLWLLFVPTVLGIAFLMVTSASGTTWHFSLLSLWDRVSPGYFYIIRIPAYVVFAVVWIWISERWAISKVDCACSANSTSEMAGKVCYSFKDDTDSYYGGESFPFDLVRPYQVASMVLYDSSKPSVNKIGMGLLYHRLVIIGHGITDLDHATTELHSVAVQAQE